MTYDPWARWGHFYAGNEHDPRNPVHVAPIDDTKPHVIGTLDCLCKPLVETRMDENDEPVVLCVIHNAWDGREHLEPNEDDDER